MSTVRLVSIPVFQKHCCCCCVTWYEARSFRVTKRAVGDGCKTRALESKTTSSRVDRVSDTNDIMEPEKKSRPLSRSIPPTPPRSSSPHNKGQVYARRNVNRLRGVARVVVVGEGYPPSNLDRTRFEKYAPPRRTYMCVMSSREPPPSARPNCMRKIRVFVQPKANRA